MNRYTTVIFDLDGTLLDTLDDLTAGVNHMLSVLKLPPCLPAQVRQWVGDGSEMLIERCLPEGRADLRFAQACHIYRDYYLTHSRDKTAPYRGIPELLTKLHRTGFQLGIVSNKFDPAVKEMAQVYFASLIDVAIGESENIRRKPAPDSLLRAIEQLNSLPKETLYVGDSEVDIMTAANAGVDCVSVTWGFRNKDHLITIGARQLIDRPEDLLPLLKGATTCHSFCL